MLDRVREKFGNLQSGTDRTDKSPSVGFVSSPPKKSEKSFLLPPDLESRIRAMARRWQYSPDELADVLDRARRNPTGWERAVIVDEHREAEFHERGLLPRLDS